MDRAKLLEGTSSDTAFARAVRRASIEVRVTFGNGDLFNDDIEYATSAIGLRMLHSYFAVSTTFFTDFLSRLEAFLSPKEIKQLSSINAARLIRRERVEQGKMTADDELVVVLGVDEIDKTLIPSPSTEGRRRYLTPIIRSLGAEMCRSSGVFLCPVLVGTIVGDIKAVISKSSHSIAEVCPTPLDESEVHKILESRGWAPDLLESSELRRCVSDFGGVPLILEKFVELLETRFPFCTTTGEGISYGQLREDTRGEVLGKFAASVDDNLHDLKELLFSVLWRLEPISLKTRFGGLSIQDLQANGVLSLGEDGRIRMPIIYMVSRIGV